MGCEQRLWFAERVFGVYLCLEVEEQRWLGDAEDVQDVALARIVREAAAAPMVGAAEPSA